MLQRSPHLQVKMLGVLLLAPPQESESLQLNLRILGLFSNPNPPHHAQQPRPSVPQLWITSRDGDHHHLPEQPYQCCPQPPCKVGWLQTELPGRVSSEVCLKPKLPAFKAMQRRRSAGEHAAHSCHPGSLSYPHTPVLGLHTSGTPRGKLTVSSDNSSGKRPLEGPYPDLLHARQPAELS